MNSYLFQFVNNPVFTASVILETILYALQQKDLLKKQHVELLLASHLQVLDLTGNKLKFDGDGMLDILYRAYIRCFVS